MSLMTKKMMTMKRADNWRCRDNLMNRLLLMISLVLLALPVSAVAGKAAGAEEAGKAFRLAAGAGDTKAVLQYLQTKKVEVDAANLFGKTALMMAVENGHFATIVALLNRGSDVDRKSVV